MTTGSTTVLRFYQLNEAIFGPCTSLTMLQRSTCSNSLLNFLIQRRGEPGPQSMKTLQESLEKMKMKDFLLKNKMSLGPQLSMIMKNGFELPRNPRMAWTSPWSSRSLGSRILTLGHAVSPWHPSISGTLRMLCRVCGHILTSLPKRSIWSIRSHSRVRSATLMWSLSFMTFGTLLMITGSRSYRSVCNQNWTP